MASAMWEWRSEAIVGRQRCQRLKCFITKQNLGKCFVAAALTHVSAGPRVVSTIESIRDLRNAAGLPETCYTRGKAMVQLSRHMCCCCVMVQPSRDTAINLNVASNRTRCITVAMHGTCHVEPVILEGAVQVRCLSGVGALSQGHGVHVPLAGQQATATEADAAEPGGQGHSTHPSPTACSITQTPETFAARDTALTRVQHLQHQHQPQHQHRRGRQLQRRRRHQRGRQQSTLQLVQGDCPCSTCQN